MSNSKFSGEDIRVITIAILGIAVVIFAGICLWFAVQGSVVGAMALTAVLFGGGFLIAQRASVSNNAADNAQLIAALSAAAHSQKDELPVDRMYKVLQDRAKAEEMVHRANKAAVQTAEMAPLPQQLPTFDVSSASIDID